MMKRDLSKTRVQTRSLRAVLFVLFFVSILSFSHAVAHAYPVPELPADNLIVNPWFRSASNQAAPGFDGWTRLMTNGVTWGPSQKESNPSPDLVVSGTCSFQQVYCGTAARWAEQSGILYPDIDVFAHQVVAADPAQRKLKFFTYYVSHRVDVGAVNIYGGSSPDGPWTLLWVPLYHSQAKSIVPESGEIRDLWEQTGFIEKIVEQGYPYYKVELQSRLPQNPIIRGVGFKLTGVYFATEFTDETGAPLPTPGSPPSPILEPDEEATGTPAETDASPTAVATPATSGAPAEDDETARGTSVAAAGNTSNQNVLTLTATALSSTENAITWNGNSRNGRGFRLERSLNGTSEWVSLATVGADTTEYLDSGLRPNTLYFYRLRISQTETSDVVSSRTEPEVEAAPPVEAALIAPALLQAVSESPRQITLTWGDLSSNEDGFVIERSSDGVNFTPIETTAPDTTSFKEENLDPAVYFYRVRSFSGSSYSSYSEIASVTVRGRSAETDTSAGVEPPAPSPAQEQSVALQWLIALAVVVLVAALVILVLLVLRMKQNKQGGYDR